MSYSILSQPKHKQACFLFLSFKRAVTSEGCVEVVIPWQLYQTIHVGPLTLHSHIHLRIFLVICFGFTKQEEKSFPEDGFSQALMLGHRSTSYSET